MPSLLFLYTLGSKTMEPSFPEWPKNTLLEVIDHCQRTDTAAMCFNSSTLPQLAMQPTAFADALPPPSLRSQIDVRAANY